MTNQYLNKLPTSYNDLNHRIYFRLMNSLPQSKPEYMEDDDEWHRYITFRYLSILLDVSHIELETLPAIQLMPMIERINFLSSEPKGSKNTLKLKTIDKWSYDDFVNYQKLRIDTFNNIIPIMKIVVLDKTTEQLENMSVSEVYECFFLLRTSMNKSLRRSQISLTMALIKQMMKVIVMKIKTLFKKKEKTQQVN